MKRLLIVLAFTIFALVTGWQIHQKSHPPDVPIIALLQAEEGIPVQTLTVTRGTWPKPSAFMEACLRRAMCAYMPK